MATLLYPAASAADRCPYHRRFSEGFRECPAFVAATYQTVDLDRRPTEPVVTCAHLSVGAGERSNHFYARCSIGSAEDRQRWVEGVTPELLGQLRSLSAAYREWVLGRMQPLWELKARYLAAIAARDTIATETTHRELEKAVAGLVAEAHGFNQQHAAELSEVGLSVDAVDAMVRIATDHWAFRDQSEGQSRVSDELLDQFPPRLRLYITAGRDPASG